MSKNTQTILALVLVFIAIALIWNGCATRKQYSVEHPKVEPKKETPIWSYVGQNPKISKLFHDQEKPFQKGTYKADLPSAISIQELSLRGYSLDENGHAILQYKKNGQWYDFVGENIRDIPKSKFEIRLKKDAVLWIKFRYKTAYQANVFNWYPPEKTSEIRNIFNKID